VIKTKEAEEERQASLSFWDKVANKARRLRDRILYGKTTNFQLATGPIIDLVREKKEPI